MSTHDSPVRLNIFALPNQVIVIVVAMVMTVLVSLLGIALQAPPVLFSMLCVLLVLLTFRRMLAEHEAAIRRRDLRVAGPRYAALQQRVSELAQQIGLRSRPIVLISAQPVAPHAHGTWRRHYIVLDHQTAEQALSYLGGTKQPKVDVLILHELQHIQHGDLLWLSFARSFLWCSVWLLGYCLLLLSLTFLFIFLVTPQLTHPDLERALLELIERIDPEQGRAVFTDVFGIPQQLQEIRRDVIGIDIIQVYMTIMLNTLPFVVTGAILLFLWQKLMHLREVYANVGTARAIGTLHPLVGAALLGMTTSEQTRQYWWQAFSAKIRQVWLQYYRVDLMPQYRLAVLRNPERMQGTRRNYAWFIGIFLIALLIIIESTSVVLVATMWLFHIPIVIATTLMGLYLLTPLMVDPHTGRTIKHDVFIIYLLYGVLLALSLSILMALWLVGGDTLVNFIDSWVNAVAWYNFIDNEPTASINLLEVVIVNILKIPVMMALTWAALTVIVMSARRMLTWYGLPYAEKRLIPLIVTMMAGVLGVLSFVVLPPITLVVLLRWNDLPTLLSQGNLVLVSLVLCVAGAALLGGLFLDRRYAQRCHQCAHSLPGPFVLGRRCEQCSTLLHPWLILHYTDAPYRPPPKEGASQ